MNAVESGRGRLRDADIDARVLSVAARHLAAHGFEAMSVAAVAHDAETTRQAVYRRWATKSELATAAMASFADDHTARAGVEPFADLVAELANFQRGVSQRGRLSLVGSMLQDSADPDAVARYRERLVAPRRQRLREIFERARTLGLIDADADLEVLVTMCTGSWYARALVGDRPPPNWAQRTAQLAWRAAGGEAPTHP